MTIGMPTDQDPAQLRLVGDAPEDIAADIESIGRIAAVPTLLEVLCESTGMGFAAVCRVTENNWTACAVNDLIDFGLQAGGQLEVGTTLCIEVKRSGNIVVIDHASRDPVYANHHTPSHYRIESYVSVPIVLSSGRYFGNLCAIDPKPALVNNPKTLGMFTKFADLIARQLDEQLLHEASRNALRDEKAAGELRDQFIAILGHDLRNPLQAVHAAGELIMRKSTEPLMISMGARIKTSVKRMSALIDDVLDFARARLGGGIGLDVAHVGDMNTPLTSVVRELQDGNPDRQILARIDVTAAVACDAGRIQQVASNLIGNALTHGGFTAPVKVTAYSDATDLVLEVWNAGRPIPPENIEKIFEPFWRNASDSRQGLGLGLHICAQIVRAHHGTLSVTSTEADGTRFVARIPLGGSEATA
jgi:signal transduction histidine kinase